MSNPLFIKESELGITKYRKPLIQKFVENKGYNTYLDKECTNLQCPRGKYRSITELHQVILGRFPNTTFNAVLRIIKELIDENKGAIQMVYCTEVNKAVLKYIGESASSYVSNYSRKNFYETKGVDGYSLSDYDRIIVELNK